MRTTYMEPSRQLAIVHANQEEEEDPYGDELDVFTGGYRKTHAPGIKKKRVKKP